MSGAGTPPGWYPDPGDPSRQRYWDGVAWTEATAPAPTEGFGSPGYGAPGYGAPGYGAPGSGTTQVGYGYAQAVGAPLAGFWVRFAAYLVDGVILSIPSNLIAEATLDGTVYEIGTSIPASFAVLNVVLLVAQLAYFAILEGTSGQTVGRMLCGIRVVDADTLQPGIGIGRGVGRYFARLLSSLPCLLGYFWMLWDDQNQTWHDKLCRTKVVRVLK